MEEEIIQDQMEEVGMKNFKSNILIVKNMAIICSVEVLKMLKKKPIT